MFCSHLAPQGATGFAVQRPAIAQEEACRRQEIPYDPPSRRLPLVMPLPPAPDGHLSIFVTANRLNMILRHVPSQTLDVPAVCASICVPYEPREAEFHLRYERDPHWRVDPESGGSVWRCTTEPQPLPDAFLNILVTPAQEPVLRARNISGMALTPPIPPEIEWSIRFFGRASAQPLVTARCGFQGPEALLPLNNSEMLWSTSHGVDMFEIDKYL